MTANPWTQVSLPVTLDQLLDGRAEALRLLSDARRITDMAKAGLDQLGSYLMPNAAHAICGCTAEIIQPRRLLLRRDQKPAPAGNSLGE